MNQDWRDLFLPHILTRGKKYWEEGKVNFYLVHGNRVAASIHGTQDYQVELDLPDGRVENMKCTCPYAVRGNCKHMAAVLYAVEAEGIYLTAEDHTPEQREDPWEEAIRNLPEAVIRKEMLLGYSTEVMRERLVIRYLRRLPKGALSEWKRMLRDYITYVKIHRDTAVLKDLTGAIKNCVFLLMEVGSVLDAFYLLGEIWKTAMKLVWEDEDGSLSAFQGWCEDLWEIHLEDATEQEAEHMLHWFWDNRNVFFKRVSDVGQLPFLFLPWSEDVKQKSLAIIDRLISQYSDCREQGLLLDSRLEIMEQLEQSKEERQEFLLRHLRWDRGRHRLLRWLNADSEHERIIVVLNHLQELDRENLPRLIRDTVWLAKMYLKTTQWQKYDETVAYLRSDLVGKLEAELPQVVNKAAAKRFAQCLKALQELPEKDIPALIDALVEKACTNPAAAGTGVAETLSSDGYLWPKPYIFPKDRRDDNGINGENVCF